MTPRSSDRCYRAETREKPDYRKSGLSAVRERQKLFTCAVILAEAAQHHRGHHRRILFLHAAHHRAQVVRLDDDADTMRRSEEHTSELQSLMRISYAAIFLKKTKQHTKLI